MGSNCILLLARLAVVMCVVLATGSVAWAQPGGPPGPRPPSPPAPPGVPADVALPGPVRVFIDCGSVWNCDLAYFRTNIAFVDHVRDREVADVHVLVTSQSTGSGGTEMTLTFFGRGPFSGVLDVLTYSAPPNAANDVVRAALAGRIKLGLIRYVSHSPAGATLQVTAPPTPAASTKPKRDPWNYWVMRVSLNGSAGGEALSSRSSLSGSLSANRTTHAWKINLSANASYRENTYDFDDGTKYTSISRNSSAKLLAVKSLSDHWSVGGRTVLESSTYTNQKHALRITPAIEYDVFPYRESTRRLLTLQYAAGVSSFAYHEVTLFERTGETLPIHQLSLALSAQQPWGQVSVGVESSQFLTALDKYRVESWGSVGLKVGKGLSVNVSGMASWIRDQIYLPQGEASRDEVLVQQRQLATSYDYSVYFGISYTFGSIYNNIVNPRFGGGGGGMVYYY